MLDCFQRNAGHPRRCPARHPHAGRRVELARLLLQVRRICTCSAEPTLGWLLLPDSAHPVESSLLDCLGGNAGPCKALLPGTAHLHL